MLTCTCSRRNSTLIRRCRLRCAFLSPRSARSCRGIVARNLVTGQLEPYAADAVVLATGGYGTAYYLSTNAVGSNVTAAWRAHKRGALFANPCFTQIHPTCIPVSGEHQSKLTLMSKSLKERRSGLGACPKWRPATHRSRFPRGSATTTSSASIRASGTWCRAMSPPATPNRSARTAAGSATAVSPCTWISPMRSRDSVPRGSRRSTATSSTCTRRSRTTIPTRFPCRSTPRSTTPWAASGLTTT